MIYIVLFILTVIGIYFLWKLKNRVILITHSGDFHLDEVFSTAVFKKKIKKEKKFFKIIRTRDKEVFKKWRKIRDEKNREVYIYDVGGIYDENKNEFDHHQIGGAGKRQNGIEFSSAGLVWKKFGLKLVDNSKLAFKNIDEEFVSAIDALDNGQEIIEKKYNFRLFSISDLIKFFLPKKRTEREMKKSFCKSVRLIDFILSKKIAQELKKEQDSVKLKEIYEASDDKRLLIIEDRKISISLISEQYPSVLFVIKKQDNNIWYIQTIKKKKDEFLRRKYLPENWGGLEYEKLDSASGVEGGIFCHRALFIASAKSRESAIKMVNIALSA